MSLSKKVGIAFAAIHLLVFAIFILYLYLSSEGQTRLLWALWLPLDFPVSLIVIAGLDWIPSDSQLMGATRELLPYFVHGIVGTIWWFFVPIIIGSLFEKLAKKGTANKVG
jgi:hypothetical protein